MLVSLPRYLGGLNLSRRLLWCYLIWYLVFAGLYFEPDPLLWLSSVGFSVLLGVAFLAGLEPAPRRWKALDRWVVARFFLIPFCASSLAALVKGRGFIVVFSPVPAENLLALGACALFFALCWGAKQLLRRTPVAT